MSLKKKLSTNILIYGVSNGLQSLVPFIMLPILTKYISADGYGVLSIIETSILFLTPFIMLNIEAGVSVEYYKMDKKNLSSYISNGIFISILSFLLVLFVFFISKNTIVTSFKIPAELVVLLPIMVILRLIPTLVLVLYQAKQKPIKYLYFSILQTLLDFTISGLFVIIFMYGYKGRLMGIYFSFFLFTVLGLYILSKMEYLSFTYSKQKITELLRFGLPLIPHTIGGVIIIMSGRYFISYFEGNSFLGLYTVAYQLGAIVLLFSRSVNQAWCPMLFSLLKEQKNREAKKITQILFVAFTLVSIIVYFGSEFLFHFLIHKSYLGAKIYFPYLLIGFLFQSLYFLFSNFFFYYKKTQVLAFITFSGSLLNLILNYFLIKKFSIIGIAYSNSITWFFFLVVVALVYKIKINKNVS